MEQNCLNHPEKAASQRCRVCGRYYCFDCLTKVKGRNEYFYCLNENCKAGVLSIIEHEKPQKRKRLLQNIKQISLIIGEGILFAVIIIIARQFVPEHFYYSSGWSKPLIADFTVRSVIFGGVIGFVYNLFFFKGAPWLWFIVWGALCWNFLDEIGVIMVLFTGAMGGLIFGLILKSKQSEHEA
jgi:hypothetical protein